eukprot:m.333310 g.333310  ORF g.333310 m.333310 type:complete len:270 (-) comp16063_c0_seq14:4518-5327(-)
MIAVQRSLGKRQTEDQLAARHKFQELYYVWGHRQSLYCILFDQTGERLVTAADDHLVKIWRVQDMRLLATLRGHQKALTDLSIDTSNTMLASASLDGTVRIWSLSSGALLQVLSHASLAAVMSVSFAPYGCDQYQVLVSTGEDHSIRFWAYHFDAEKDGSPVFEESTIAKVTTTKSTDRVMTVDFTRGGLFFATGSSSHEVHVRIAFEFNADIITPDMRWSRARLSSANCTQTRDNHAALFLLSMRLNRLDCFLGVCIVEQRCTCPHAS